VLLLVKDVVEAAELSIDDLAAVEDQQMTSGVLIETALAVELSGIGLLDGELLELADGRLGAVALLDREQHGGVHDAVDLAEGGQVLDHVRLGIPAQLLLVMHAQRIHQIIHLVAASLEREREQTARTDELIDALVNEMLPRGQDLVSAVVAQQLQGGQFFGKLHVHQFRLSPRVTPLCVGSLATMT
jgi:hypothetical protein